jgi:large subunit ribosomal protein L9
MASPKAISKLESQLKLRSNKQAQVDANLAAIAGKLEGQQVELKAKVGAKDRLYGSITNADIAAALEKATGIVVDKRKIELERPIHQVGSFDIAIKLGKNILPKIKVIIVEEEPTKYAR